jgi:hypothetical protein
MLQEPISSQSASLRRDHQSANAVTEVPAVALSRDGRRVAAGVASDGNTAVWEVPEGKRP